MEWRKLWKTLKLLIYDFSYAYYTCIKDHYRKTLFL